MSAVLIATLDAGGNLPPALALARLLRERGDAVRFIASPRQLPAIRSAGFDAEAWPTAAPVDATRPGSLPSIALRQVAAFADPRTSRDLLAEAARQRADLVVVDCLLVAAVRDGVAAGLPLVSLVHTLWSFFESVVTGPFGALLRLRGVDAAAALHAPSVKLVTALPQLETGALDVEGVRHLGPLDTTDAAEAAPAEPTVLVSMSTTALPGQRATLQRVLDGAGRLPVRVIVTTGPAVDPEDLRLPANASAHAFLDHAAVLPRVSLVVCHGGHGTTARALAHGIPVLALPLNPLIDQPWIARGIERAGVGRRLPARSRPDRLEAELGRLTGDGPEREAARAMGVRLRAARPAGALEEALASMP